MKGAMNTPSCEDRRGPVGHHQQCCVIGWTDGVGSLSSTCPFRAMQKVCGTKGTVADRARRSQRSIVGSFAVSVALDGLSTM